jgi:hypothetical protein
MKRTLIALFITMSLIAVGTVVVLALTILNDWLGLSPGMFTLSVITLCVFIAVLPWVPDKEAP